MNPVINQVFILDPGLCFFNFRIFHPKQETENGTLACPHDILTQQPFFLPKRISLFSKCYLRTFLRNQ